MLLRNASSGVSWAASGAATRRVASARRVMGRPGRWGDGTIALDRPARELLGDLLLELGRPDEAATAYAGSLAIQPGRARSFFGAARAAELALAHFRSGPVPEQRSVCARAPPSPSAIPAARGSCRAASPSPKGPPRWVHVPWIA